MTLGIYSTNPETNQSIWICWDIDSEQEEALAKLIRWLDGFGITVLRESVRPGRSGHVWLFCDEPVCTEDLYRLGAYGRLLSGLDCEVFSKQPYLRPGQLGNLVRLPLGSHQKPSAGGVRGLFAACPSNDIVDQLFWFLEQPTNSVALIQEVVSNLPKMAPKPKPKIKHENMSPLLDRFPPDWPMKDLPNKEIEARCPACAAESHDSQCKNLNINPTENLLHCFYGHSFKQIMDSLAKIKELSYNTLIVS